MDTRIITYDDFSDNGAGYFQKWQTWDNILPGLEFEPEALKSRNFSNNCFNLRAVPFTQSYDSYYDHIKYMATSLESFPIPKSGSVMASADITALTPGAVSGHVLPTTGAALLEGQQAAATLHLINLKTGQLYDWFVSENKAFCLVERLFVEIGLEKGYTHIFNEVDIEPGIHTYAIRYTKFPGDIPDKAEWLIDGVVRASVRNSGIPLDKQYPEKFSNITWPSLGPGEPVKDRMTEFVIAHGLFSLLDEFPFNQFEAHKVSIPKEERIFGQGVIATFADFKVEITKQNMS